MDSPAGAPPPAVAAAAPPHPALSRPSPFPGREDCWTDEATFTLIDAWGSRYLALSRGNLRQTHWNEVAAAVNAAHGQDGRHRRTDVQCKNRIDTLKKKYKLEKGRVSDSGDGAGGGYSGAWPFFHRLDSLIGDNYPAKKRLPPEATADGRKSPPAMKSPPWTVTPVGPRSGTKKRPASVEDSYFRRNFSVFAAAESEDWERSIGNEGRKKGMESDEDWELGYRELAHAIEKVGKIYERVEAAKRRQMVELEKQRMQFAKDLEYERMQLFMETQVHIHKIKRSKRSSGADSFS